MLSGDVRKGDWGMYGDVDWVKFDNENSRFHSIGGNIVGGDASLSTNMDIKGGFITLAGMYSLGHGQDGYADLIFGGRYLWIKNNLGWNFTFNGDHFGLADSGHVSSQTHVSDALIGIRGRWIPGGGNWYIPHVPGSGLRRFRSDFAVAQLSASDMRSAGVICPSPAGAMSRTSAHRHCPACNDSPAPQGQSTRTHLQHFQSACSASEFDDRQRIRQ